VRRDGERWIVTITPDAGTVKTNKLREIPLHPHPVEMGFSAFVQLAPLGHLFLTPAGNGNVLGPLRGVKNRDISAMGSTASVSRSPRCLARSPRRHGRAAWAALRGRALFSL
jgi:hypothetical protein